MDKPTTVLLVDDDDDVRQALRRSLSIEGYKVFESGSGAEALRLLQAIDCIDVVIADFDMPGMDGLDLLRRVRICWPPVFRVLLTGRTDVSLAIKALNEQAAHRYFLKPYDTFDLPGSLRIGLCTTQRPS